MSQPESSNSSSFTNTYPSNFSSFNYTYHVFLSFRGCDTRYGFTGHLYQALSEKGIHTFKDDEELRKGEGITPALLKAIEESWIFIVVLSKNYASSTFCLQELVKILECVKQKGRLVLPIFYGVNPSDVRHMKESYGEAFIKHEARIANDKEKVKRWKEALQEVSNLSGWHLQGCEYEYVLIRKIVEELSRKTRCIILHIADYPVGLEFQVKILSLILDIESNERVIMAGVHGIGGIGKTTIVRAMYNLIAHQFEGVCFLANVRERSNQNNGLVKLQELLLSEMVRGNNIKWSDVYRGIPIMKQMLNKKKVLLILDDVDELNQLKALAGGLDWFGSGSRIIITTRDEHLLDTHGVERKYMVEALNNEEAFRLLSWNAFKSNMIDVSYQGILDKFVKYCSGLPLALEVIGSNLFGKGLNEWESALDTYKKVPNRNIQEVLKVSYDHLDENEKGIFLDVACFFGGCKLEYAQRIIRNGHDLHPEYGVGVLIQRSLIKICSGCIVMHDLIRDMGREIVRQESPQNPGKRSRLWYYEDIHDVFEENKGTDEIKAIMLNAPRDIKVQWDGHALEKMKSLRILTVKNACFSCGPKHLPNSLRILDWKQYPSSSLPSDFNPRKLTILNLNSSCLILDKPFQDFVSLSEINLSNSNVERVPCVSGAPGLRKIILDGCQKLIEVHGSIGLLDKLETLSADDCKNLRIFPEVIHSTSLENFDLKGCISLSNFPQMLGIMKKIRILNLHCWDLFDEFKTSRLLLDRRDSNYELRSGFLMLRKLDGIMKGSFDPDKYHERASSSGPLKVPRLSVSCCNSRYQYPSIWLNFFPNLEELNMSHCYDEIDQFLSTWHPCFASLKGLNLTYTHLTDEFLSTRLPWFPNLQSLDLGRNNFKILPECIKECHYSRNLSLNYCTQLREIRGMPPNIKILSATCCTSLSVQFSSMLLTQAISMATKEILLPGVMPPKWFACKQPSQSLSFWVRDKFPKKIALCLVIGLFERTIDIDLLVNGIKHHSIFSPFEWTRQPHIYLVHLERESDFIEEVPIGPGWNHVRVVANEGQVHWMGVHIYKEGNGTENVRFTNPNSEKEKVVYLGGTNPEMEKVFYLGGTNSGKEKVVYLGGINSEKEKIVHLSGPDYEYAIHLTKKWCSLLDKQVLNFGRPLEYGWDLIQISNRVRKMQAPIKVKFLVWNAFQDALPTCMNLFRSKIIKCPLCPICETEYETIEHVFMFCEWTRPVWFGSDLKWFVDDLMWLSESATWLFADVHKIISRRMDGGQPYNKIMGTLGNICWAIWKGRNEYIFEDKSVDPQLALFRVKALCKQYSHCYPLVQRAVNSTNATTLQGQMIENNNRARGKSVLMASSNSNTRENIGQDGLSSDHNVTWDAPIASSSGDNKDQLTTIRKKRKRNRCRCSSVRSCKKPRLDQGTKWKRNPIHCRLSRQLLQRYKPVFRKGS